MKRFKLGHLVSYVYSDRRKGTEGENIGFVFDVRYEDIQLLELETKTDIDHPPIIKINRTDLIEGELPEEYCYISDRILLVKKKSIVQIIGRINVQKIDEILRKMIQDLVEKHYEEVHKKHEPFIPGETHIRYAGRIYDQGDLKALMDSCLDFWLTEGRFVKRFKEKFARLLGVKYCVLTNSGSSANLLAISALTSHELGKRRLCPGDEVITTACSFPTTINPIIQNNLMPVFLDVGIETYNVQVHKIEDAISAKTKAIFLAHTLGNPFDLDKVLQIADKHNLWVIEDNCDALGSRYNGRYTGTFGHIATFSFYPAHQITMGEGGALTTDDAQLKRLIESFKDWGRDCWCESGHDNTCGKRFGWKLGDLPFGYDHKYVYSHIGYNLKVTDMQAAVGVAQLKKLPSFIEARKKNWQLLYEGLNKFEEFFILPKATPNSEPAWFGFLLTVREDAPFSRNDIVKYLERNRIATRMLFAGNIIRQPSFRNVAYRVFGGLVKTDLIMDRTFWIGVYPGMTQEMIDFILEKIHDFIRMYESKF